MIRWPEACSKSPSISLNTCWIEAADNSRSSPACNGCVSASIATAAYAMMAREGEEIARLDRVISAPPLFRAGAALETTCPQETGWLRSEPDGVRLYLSIRVGPQRMFFAASLKNSHDLWSLSGEIGR